MSKTWILSKRNDFARDVFRDFCLAADEFDTMFKSFEQTGLISFPDLKQLIGSGMSKGLLWRLKDTSHHFFRNDPADHLVGRFLDWALGYIFHEAMKLKEDAYQQQSYVPWFMALDRTNLPEPEDSFCSELVQILAQTRESIIREVNRIKFIIDQCKRMFPKYFRTQHDNHLLARFLFKQHDLVQKVFGSHYPELIASIYGDTPEQMYALAARSLREGGWIKDANAAVEKALALNPRCRQSLTEQRNLEPFLE